MILQDLVLETFKKGISKVNKEHLSASLGYDALLRPSNFIATSRLLCLPAAMEKNDAAKQQM